MRRRMPAPCHRGPCGSQNKAAAAGGDPGGPSRGDTASARRRSRGAAAPSSRLVGGPQTVCAYVPIRFEPGSIALLDTLLRSTCRVLLPVARSDADGVPQPMQWGEYRPGRARRGAVRAARTAGAVAARRGGGRGVAWCSCPRWRSTGAGVRLGRGAGFYDRSLPLADPAARLVAVVRDDELVDELPAEPHDVRDDPRADAAAGARRHWARSAARQHVLHRPLLVLRTPTARRPPSRRPAARRTRNGTPRRAAATRSASRKALSKLACPPTASRLRGSLAKSRRRCSSHSRAPLYQASDSDTT